MNDRAVSYVKPRFHLLGIAGDVDGIDRICEAALRFEEVTFGLMLRDPAHREEAMHLLAAHAAERRLPPNVDLIGNSTPLASASFLHLTASQLMELSSDALLALTGQKPFGASAHSLDEAKRAAHLGASYITLSPIFPTSSKPGHPGIGLDALRRIATSLPLPLYALGGMNTVDHIIAALGAGAYGIASISLFEPAAGDVLEKVVERLRGMNDEIGSR